MKQLMTHDMEREFASRDRLVTYLREQFLLQRVCTVSVKTMEIIQQMPTE